MTEIRMLNVYSFETDDQKKKTIKISHTQFLTHTWPIWNVLAKIIKQKQQKNYSTLSFKLIICNGLSVRFQIFTLHAVFKLFCSTFVLIFVILVHFFFFFFFGIWMHWPKRYHIHISTNNSCGFLAINQSGKFISIKFA